MRCTSKPICSEGFRDRGEEFFENPKPDYCKLIVLGTATQLVPEAVTTTPAGGQTFIAPKDGVMYAVVTPMSAVVEPLTYQLVINNVVVQTQTDATEDQSVAFDFVVGKGDRVRILQYSTATTTQSYTSPTTEITFAPYKR